MPRLQAPALRSSRRALEQAFLVVLILESLLRCGRPCTLGLMLGLQQLMASELTAVLRRFCDFAGRLLEAAPILSRRRLEQAFLAALTLESFDRCSKPHAFASILCMLLCTKPHLWSWVQRAVGAMVTPAKWLTSRGTQSSKLGVGNSISFGRCEKNIFGLSRQFYRTSGCSSSVEQGRIGYLTTQESLVKGGQSQFQEGSHVLTWSGDQRCGASMTKLKAGDAFELGSYANLVFYNGEAARKEKPSTLCSYVVFWGTLAAYVCNAIFWAAIEACQATAHVCRMAAIFSCQELQWLLTPARSCQDQYAEERTTYGVWGPPQLFQDGQPPSGLHLQDPWCTWPARTAGEVHGRRQDQTSSLIGCGKIELQPAPQAVSTPRLERIWCQGATAFSGAAQNFCQLLHAAQQRLSFKTRRSEDERPKASKLPESCTAAPRQRGESSSARRALNPARAGQFLRQVASRSHQMVSASKVLKPWAKRRWQNVSSCLRVGFTKGRRAWSRTLSAGRHKLEGRRTRQAILHGCRKKEKKAAEEEEVENEQSVTETLNPQASECGMQKMEAGKKAATSIARPLASLFWGARQSTKRLSLSMDSPHVAHRAVAYAMEKRRRISAVEGKASTAGS